MLFLWLLTVKLLTINTVSGVWDEKCVDNCLCCIEEKCGPRFVWTNACTIGCIDGHRGVRCYELCQYENCKSCGSNSDSRECEQCYDGYYLGQYKDCASQCPSNCKLCTSSTICSECKEGFYNKDGSTACNYAHCPVNCECNDQGNCVVCKIGYYDTSTLCTKQCPVNCLTCESEESCSKCKYGFYKGYEYDNNINLLLNNCSHACRGNCTQCQSYNTCIQCINGKYGKTCQEDCSVGCTGKTCLFDSGQCDCKVNFTGDKCMKCVDGKYGLSCKETCPKYCKGKICERTSGYCNDGCINERFSRTTCSTCLKGMFGELCDKECPVNCKDNTCKRYSGNCRDGCKENFDGTKCDLCIQGKYGTYCELNCPVHCADKVCNRNSGTCFDCVGNFEGKMCDECKPGYYGQMCDVPCSLHCANYSCSIDTGNCLYGCMDGFSGDKCCVTSKNCLECNTNAECKTCVPGFFKRSCNETCLGCCSGSCDISTGKCIISKDAPNTVPVATAAVLGSMFTLAFALNIVLVLFAVYLKRKIQFFQRKQSRTQSELTYENQLQNIDEQFLRTTRVATKKTVETIVYEGINIVNEQEHEYQHVTYDHGFMAPCSSSVGKSVCVPRPDCRNPLDSVTCRDKWCCKRRVYAEENAQPPAGDCICVNPWQQCGEELKPFFYSHPKPDCACCECNVKCVRLLGAELCSNGLPPIGECTEHTDVYCCNPNIEAMNEARPDGMLKPLPCRCYNGRCPSGWKNKGKCKECCIV